MNIIDALLNLRPDAEWVVRGDVIEWLDQAQTQPTEEEIQAKIQELQAEHEASEYQRQRAAAYPSWQDQLDKIYHEGIDAWKAEIQAIKDQYPKPDGA